MRRVPGGGRVELHGSPQRLLGRLRHRIRLVYSPKNISFKVNGEKKIAQGCESKSGIVRGSWISRPDPALDLDPNQALVMPN